MLYVAAGTAAENVCTASVPSADGVDQPEVPIPLPTPAAPADPTAPAPLFYWTDDGPYAIGDCIIWQCLVGAKHLNGVHYHIADVRNNKSKRYPVALDLLY